MTYKHTKGKNYPPSAKSAVGRRKFANVQVTPPLLQAIRFATPEYDCERISGLVSDAGSIEAPDPDGLVAR